jgi:integrase
MGSVFLRTRTHKDGKKVSYWYIEYRLNGKKKKESVGAKGLINKSIAKELLKKKEQQIKLGQLDMLDSEIPNLIDFSRDYLAHVKQTKQNRSWKRTQQCLSHLDKFFGGRKLNNITSKDIDDYKLFRQKQMSKNGKYPASATINRELACLKNLFNLAKRWKKFFGENPVSEAGLLGIDNQVERILNPDEEGRLLDSCAPHIRPIIITALNTGMRKGEILSLRWENIDFDNNSITIQATNSKTKKMKRIRINSALRKLLLELKLGSGGSEFVFLGVDKKPIKSFRTAFSKACKRAGIRGLRFHDLRHTAATRMIEGGANLVAVSHALGHSSINMTMRYAHPDDTITDAFEILANFGKTTTQLATQRDSKER